MRAGSADLGEQDSLHAVQLPQTHRVHASRTLRLSMDRLVILSSHFFIHTLPCVLNVFYYADNDEIKTSFTIFIRISLVKILTSTLAKVTDFVVVLQMA